VEELAGQLRWHRGSPSSYDAGPLAIAVLADQQHGPAVSIADDYALLVHGGELEPPTVLQDGEQRFAALEWDGHTLRASRDALGEVPLFVRIVDGVAWFATETHPLVAVAPTRPDLEALAAEAAFVPYVMRTAWREIFRVPPGSTATVDGAMNFSVKPHWRPDRELATRRGAYADVVQEFRRRFEAAVARRRSDSDGLLLSGGLDSAAVAVAARGGRRPPRLITVTFPDLPETDEAEYARATADAVGAPLTVLTGRTDRWTPEGEAAVFGTTSLLLPTSIFDVAMAAFAAEGVETVLDGHDGDGALGLYTDIYGLLIAHLELRRLLGYARRFGWRPVGRATVRGALPPWLRHVPGRSRSAADNLSAPLLPFFRGTTARRMVAEVRWRPPRASWKRHQLQPVTPPLTVLLEQMEAAAARYGVDVAHPFADHSLLRFLISLPYSLKVDPDRSKPLLRDGLGDLLPEKVRSRGGKVTFEAVLERRVDPAACLDWVRESGVELPDVDYPALYLAAERDPGSLQRAAWIRLARTHAFAAGA